MTRSSNHKIKGIWEFQIKDIKCTIYSDRTSMHGGIDIFNFKTENFFCLRFPHYSVFTKRWIHGYAFVSPNATPWAATKWYYGRKYCEDD